MTEPSSVQVRDELTSAAIRAGRWIRATADTTPQGLTWSPDPEQNPGRKSRSYYEGSAGIGLFLIQLAHVTGDESWLGDAAAAGRELWTSYRPDASPPANILFEHPIDASRWSFYTGAVGEANLFLELLSATGDRVWRDATLRIAEDVADAGNQADGCYWADQPGLLNDGGTTLFLLRAGRELERPDLAELGVRAGRRIVQQAEQTPSGLRWRSIDGSLLGAPGAYWPGLEFGNSGVAYALARLYEATGEAEFLQAAELGAAWIKSLAVEVSDGVLVPYRLPDKPELYYLGTCNGAAGIVRMFYQLWSVTGTEEYLEWCERLVRGILATGAPQRHSPGYWHTTSLCCGTAALVHLGVGLWAGTGRAQFLELAEDAARQLLGEEFREDDHPEFGRWYEAFSRLDPAAVTARSSYSIGVAGIGSALIHLHLARAGRLPILRTLDDPFPLATR